MKRLESYLEFNIGFKMNQVKRISFHNSESATLRGSHFDSFEDAAKMFSWARYQVHYGSVDKTTVCIEFKDGTIFSARADVPHIDDTITLYDVFYSIQECANNIEHRFNTLSRLAKYADHDRLRKRLNSEAEVVNSVMSKLGLDRVAA